MKPKAFSILPLLLVAMLLLGACAPRRGATASVTPSTAPTKEMTTAANVDNTIGPQPTVDRLIVHFFAVGKADSILVQQGAAAMLIDGGTVDEGPDIAGWLSEAGVDQLQQIVVTHSDSDHVGGVVQIMRLHRPQAFMMPSIDDQGKDYQQLIKAVGKMGMEISQPKPGMTFQLGEATITVLAPIRDDYDTPDNYSIVLRVDYGETSFLFAGDATEESETDMLMHNANLKATVLKVGHHGQNDASTKAFLNAVKPQAAVISDGPGEEGAAQKVLERLADVGTDVYRTSQAGTVVATSDGKNVTFNVAPSPPEKRKDKKK